MTSKSLPKADYIDALRGLAACGVVATHCSQSAPASLYVLQLFDYLGREGVQLFFVLSALTLLLSWHRRAATEASPIRNFYVRRFFRIAPLFYVALVGYLLLYGVGPSYWAPDGIHWYHVLASATFLHGLSPETVNTPVPGSWSIAVEVLFYALFPLLVVLASTLTRTIILLLVTLVFEHMTPWLVGALYLTPGASFTLVNEFALFNIVAQLPIFVCGILVFHLLQRKLEGFWVWIAVTSLLLLGAVFFLQPGLLTHHLVAGAFFANLVLLLAHWPVVALVNPLTRWLGKLSYGIYLSQFAVITLMERLGVQHWVAQPDVENLLFFAVVLAVTALFALGLHYAIELPFIRLGNRRLQQT